MIAPCLRLSDPEDHSGRARAGLAASGFVLNHADSDRAGLGEILKRGFRWGRWLPRRRLSSDRGFELGFELHRRGPALGGPDPPIELTVALDKALGADRVVRHPHSPLACRVGISHQLF